MTTTTTPATTSRTAARVGWVLTGLLALFLIFDVVGNSAIDSHRLEKDDA